MRYMNALMHSCVHNGNAVQVDIDHSEENGTTIVVIDWMVHKMCGECLSTVGMGPTLIMPTDIRPTVHTFAFINMCKHDILNVHINIFVHHTYILVSHYLKL